MVVAPDGGPTTPQRTRERRTALVDASSGLDILLERLPLGVDTSRDDSVVGLSLDDDDGQLRLLETLPRQRLESELERCLLLCQHLNTRKGRKGLQSGGASRPISTPHRLVLALANASSEDEDVLWERLDVLTVVF